MKEGSLNGEQKVWLAFENMPLSCMIETVY